MSVLSKIFTVPEGNPVFIPTGLSSTSILLVIRSGKVHKRMTGLVANYLEWYWAIGRIHFNVDLQFVAGEKIIVLYKV